LLRLIRAVLVETHELEAGSSTTEPGCERLLSHLVEEENDYAGNKMIIGGLRLSRTDALR
jgi:hypothetical protein